MILIDAEMPKRCYDCPCYDEEVNWCNASTAKYEMLSDNEPNLDKVETWKARAEWCPLIEVIDCMECKHKIPFGDGETCDLFAGVKIKTICISGERKDQEEKSSK